MTRAGWDLVVAVSAATGVLGMLELPREEIPPERYWHHDERLEEWFASVRQKRTDRASGLDPVPEADEDSVDNELVRNLRR